VTTPAVPTPPPDDRVAVRTGVLPSGRTVTVRADGGTEAIEIRSPGGEMELRIALTDRGPVLSLRGARLEIDAADAVAVNCRQFEVHAAEGVVLTAAGDVAIRSGGDTSIDGRLVKLNCQDRGGYPDGAALPEPNPPAPFPLREGGE
jgi:hypothetical protein